jgi:hypothetical protein
MGQLRHHGTLGSTIVAVLSIKFQAAGTYGATVDTLTISVEQKVAIDKTIAEAGLTHMITVHVLDYRSIPDSFHHAFDAVVSIGVMEHSESMSLVFGFPFMSVFYHSRDRVHGWVVQEAGLGHEARELVQSVHDVNHSGLPLGSIFQVRSSPTQGCFFLFPFNSHLAAR